MTDICNTPERLGQIAFDVIRNNFHRPLVAGKCNRLSVEDNIIEGIYCELLPPMSKKEVDFICDLVDDLIEMYGKKSA